MSANSIKIRRRDRRVLLALLSDAENLSGAPIADTAQVSHARVHRVLARLVSAGYVTREAWTRADDHPRRRFYRLTSEGRAWAHAELGLLPRRPTDCQEPENAT